MFVLDYKSGQPIYEQLYRSITRLAALGGLEENEQMPSVRALAQELGVNPNTVQKAYRMLERDGILVSVPGKGSFLSPDFAPVERKKQLALGEFDAAVARAADGGVTACEMRGRIDAYFQGRDPA